MSIVEATAHRPDIGVALRDTWSALCQRWPAMFGLMVLLAAAPTIADQVLLIDLYRGPLDAAPTATVAALRLAGVAAPFLLLTWWGTSVLSLALDSLGGARRSLLATLGEALRAAVILLPVRVAESWAFWILPFMPLRENWQWRSPAEFGVFVTGLALIAVWGVLGPVVVAERRGLLSAFGRAARLMSGARWPLVASYVAMRALVTLPYLMLPLLMITFGTLGVGRQVLFGGNLVMIVLRLVISAPFGVFEAAYYRQLCRMSDGVAPGEAALVFD
jgi:hypothetical protein